MYKKIKYKIGYLSGAPRITTRKNPDTSGPRSHINGFIKGLEKNGIKVNKWIVGDKMPRTISTKKTENIISKNYISRLITDLTRVILNLYNRRKAYKHLNKKVDLVYERLSTFSNLGLIFKKNGIPWIIETNAPLTYESNKERATNYLYKISEKIEKRAYERADMIVCVSKTLKEIIQKRFNIPSEKIIVIPNGIDIHLFNFKKTKKILSFNNPSICFTGRLIKWQNLDILLNAIIALKKENINISLVIIGDGPLKNELINKAIVNEIKDNLIFTGQIPHEKIPQYINSCDFGYAGHLPLSIGSMYHSPLKLYEYLALGKPVICTKSDDANTIIKEGINGYYFKPKNKESLIQAIKKAIKNKENTKKDSFIIAKEINKNHNWEKRTKILLKELQRRDIL